MPRVPAFKAFDSVDHLIVINKLKALNISDNIIHWVVSFLTDRNQFVKVEERWSFTKMIKRSIVQDSGLGPTLFTICIFDLQLIGSSNCITKYAAIAAWWYLRSVMLICKTNFHTCWIGLSQINWPYICVKQKNLYFTDQMPETIWLLQSCLA